jgi:hypothetical protein
MRLPNFYTDANKRNCLVRFDGRYRPEFCTDDVDRAVRQRTEVITTESDEKITETLATKYEALKNVRVEIIYLPKYQA